MPTLPCLVDYWRGEKLAAWKASATQKASKDRSYRPDQQPCIVTVQSMATKRLGSRLTTLERGERQRGGFVSWAAAVVTALAAPP